MSGPAAPARGLTPLVALCVFAWTATVATLYLVNPTTAGRSVMAATYFVMTLVIIFGPLARKARPLSIWGFEALGGVAFCVALILRPLPGVVGPLRYSDIANFVGYGCFVIWLVLLYRHVGGEKDRGAFFDAAGVTVATILALWSGAVGPLVGQPELPLALLWAVYPTVDVLVLMLCIHLVIARGGAVTTMKWVLPSMAFILLVDASAALHATVGPGGPTPDVLNVAYILGYGGVAIAAGHPSVVTLTEPPVRRRRNPGTEARTVLDLCIMSPAILSIAVPISGTTDAVVRTVLVAALLTIVFLRLTTTVVALRHAESDSHHRATHDQLTGLLNRASLLDTLSERLQSDAAAGRHTAVLFLDCDDFKAVNDTWGHHAGDNLLRDIARRLPAHLAAGDVLARHGGDEFVVVASIDAPGRAAALAERVLRFFDDPSRILPDRPHTVTPSIGVAVALPGEEIGTQEFLGRADAAMYEAKRRGRARYVVYDAALESRTRLRAAVGDKLGDAVRRAAFDLHLQPVMGGPDYDRIVAWEALARWHDPTLGNVPPDVFIPLAEQFGLIRDLGNLILRRACRDLAQLRDAYGRDDLSICINVSPAQLLQPDFADSVRAAREAAGLPRDCVWLEITETLLVDKGPAALITLAELHEAGVRICIDDFGTGYASLSTLLRLPVDCVKLDKSLTARLTGYADGPRQVTAVIDLVRSLGITTIVAEGVETPGQGDILKAMGCPYVQGWLYGRPAGTTTILAALDPTPQAGHNPSLSPYGTSPPIPTGTGHAGPVNGPTHAGGAALR